MSFTLLSGLIILLFLSIAFLEIYNGVKRGFRLSLISLANTVLSLFLSFLVTSWISSAVTSAIMEEMGKNELYLSFSNILPTLGSTFPAVIQMALGGILFLVVYLLVFLTMKVFVFWIYGLCTKREESDPGYGEDSPAFASRQSRAMGAACGILSAIVLTTSLTAPVMGALEVADDVLNIVKQTSTVAYESIGPGNAALVREFTKDPLGRLLYQGGGRAIFNGAASTTVSGKKVYLLDEANTISDMSEDMFAVYVVFCDPKAASDEHAIAMRRLAVNMKDLKLCARLSADIVKQCASAWHKGEAFLQLAPPEMNGFMKPVFDEILGVCANTNFLNVNQNMGTMLEVYALIVESGILNTDQSNAREMLALLETHGTVGKINEELSQNPYMKHINVNSIAMTVFASYTEYDLSTDQRRALTSAVAQAIVRARQTAGVDMSVTVASLADDVRDHAKEQGMELSSEFSILIAEQLLGEITAENVTVGDVDRLLEQYLPAESEVPV